MANLMSPGTIRHTGLYVTCLTFLPDFNEICNFSAHFDRSPQYQISLKSFLYADWRTEGRTGGRTNSLIKFQSKKALSWRFNVAGNNTAYLGPQVNCQILTKFGFSRQIFIKVSNNKCHGNPSSASRANTCGQRTDRRTGMTKEFGAIRDYVNRHKNIRRHRTKLFPERPGARDLCTFWSARFTLRLNYSPGKRKVTHMQRQICPWLKQHIIKKCWEGECKAPLILNLGTN
jgi:hypothetical protein